MPEIMVMGKLKSYEKGTTFYSIAKEHAAAFDAPICLVYFNGKMTELFKKVEKDGVINFITCRDSAGHKTYVRTAEMMLIKAVRNLTGGASSNVHVRVEFGLHNSIFCIVKGTEVNDAFADAVRKDMERMRDMHMPIGKKSLPIDDAIELFRHQNMQDKVRLFHYRRSSSINVYTLDGFNDYFYGHMLPNTEMVTLFDVRAYKGGLLLTVPTRENPNELEPFKEEESLFEQLMLSNTWGDLMEINTVADLNDKICTGDIKDLILIQEALMERRIGEIAQKIHDRKDVKIVMIAGPSSSGKTTFARRLAIQLKSFGLRPHTIGMDDYFVNRDKTPVDEDGNYNFDVIEAVDIEQFEEDMSALLDGETVEMPTFDFKIGKRIYKGNTMKLEEDDILVIEGIHALNPLSTNALPKDRIYKVYISAMNSLNIDEHNRIPSTDVRMIRRMIRDARTRAHDARMTIGGWKKVRDGEDIYIFPYQDEADSVFNSSICYELSVLKQFAEPLLYNVEKKDPEYHEAKRLLKFFSYFLGIDTENVPVNSICREFIGGGFLG